MKIKVFRSVSGIVLGGALSFLCACARIAEPILPQTAADEGARVSVRVLLPSGEPTGTPTRSCWTGSPDQVESFVLMAYRDGSLDACVSARAGTGTSIRLFKDQVYRLYALANVPDFVPPLKEVELSLLSLPVGDFQQANALPMACRVDAFVPIVPGQTLTLTFERLFARLVLHLDKGEWGMLHVGSVRLRQAAAYLHPFAASDAQFDAPFSEAAPFGVGAGAPSDASAFVDGDAASEADLQRLNAGDSLVLYVPQNRQGTLLPGNDDPYRRVPDSLGDKAGRCTYLELAASPDGDAVLTGDALCRIYLGLNAADNFDIPGNAILNVSVFLTERLMAGWGWRIDSRLSWLPGVVTGWLAEGMHELDDLYVGEVFRYAVQPSNAFLEMVGGDFSRCSLCFIRSADATFPGVEERDTSLVFSAWTPSEEGVWYTDVHCRKPVDAGSIRLCLDGNESLPLSDGLVVRLPVFSLQSPSDVFINAATATSCPLDIRDGRGCSLADAYGFDVALFSPRYSLTLRQDAVTLQTDIPPLSTFSQWTAEPPSTSAPFGACRLTFAHTGNRPEVAHFLTESLQRDSIFRLQVQDARYFIEDTCSVRTDMLPIRVKLCDAEEADAPWMLCVSNPSALPLEWGLVLLPRIESHCAAEGPVSYRQLTLLLGPNKVMMAERQRMVSSSVQDSLDLQISSATLTTHCRSLGFCYEGLYFVGLEPALLYGERLDARLDGKIEADCSISVGTPPVWCLLASDSATWSVPEQASCEPVWLRYSAYDDIGQVRVTAGFSPADRLPTASCRADDDDHLFQIDYFGYINGLVYVESKKFIGMGSNYFYTMRKYYYAGTDGAIPSDGQTRLCPIGSFLPSYREILWQNDILLEDGNYRYHPQAQSIQYGVGIQCEPVTRLYVPVVSGSLSYSYYDPRFNAYVGVASTLTSITQTSLYMFDH